MGKEPIPITGKAPYAINEITIKTWYRSDGDHISEFDPLLRVDSEKAEVDIESPGEGTLQIAPGMEIDDVNREKGIVLRRPADKYGEKDDPNSKWILTFGWIVAKDKEKQPEPERGKTHPVTPSAQPNLPIPEAQSTASNRSDTSSRLPKCIASAHGSVRAILAAPPVWQEAKKRGIDLADVKGTGPGGRIKLSDLPSRKTAEVNTTAAVQTEVSVPQAQSDLEIVADHENFVIEKTDSLDTRRAIAKNMELSARCIPGVPAEVHVDFRRILEAYDLLGWMDSQGEINLEPAKKYLRLEIIVIEGVLRALESEHRKLNSVWGCEHFKEFRYAKKFWSSIHLGIAYQRSDGLVVPVLHHMEKATYRMIGDQLFDLYDRMHGNKASKEDFRRDGTFTFNNVGALGSDGGASLVVHGQSVICSLHRVERNISSPFYGIGTLSASFDHRIHDGAPVVAFLVSVKRFIEQMQPLDFILHFREAMGANL